MINAMKIRLGDLRRLIREALEGEDLALYEWKPRPGYIKIVLYSPEKLLALDWSDRSGFPAGIVKGYASFHKPDQPCKDAWEVFSIAGIGYGKLLYGLGYSLVPTGRLMPSRTFSSPRAKEAWGKQVGKLKSYPLDDISAPEEKKRTPKDPSDDCELQKPIMNGGPDHVMDAAYEGGGVDPTPMRVAHKRVVRNLMIILNDLGAEYTSVEEVDKMLGDMLRMMR